MNELDTRYFEWLVGLTGELGEDYTQLLECAFQVKFRSIVPNDDNRAEEGLALREEFGFGFEMKPLAGEPCTMLEMMIGLSRRMNQVNYDWKDPDKSDWWLWTLMGNLNLMQYDNDVMDPLAPDYVRTVFERVSQRTYRSNGRGGLFPLKRPSTDVREVELWYQLMHWLDENLTE